VPTFSGPKELTDVIEFEGGAYVKIGLRWYRLDRLRPDEEDEARAIVQEREDQALRELGLTPKKRG